MVKHFFRRFLGCSCVFVRLLSLFFDTEAKYVFFTTVEASSGDTFSGSRSTSSDSRDQPEATVASSGTSSLPFFILLPASRDGDGNSPSKEPEGALKPPSDQSKSESSEDTLALKNDLKRVSELVHRACNTRKIYKIVNPDTGELLAGSDFDELLKGLQHQSQASKDDEKQRKFAKWMTEGSVSWFHLASDYFPVEAGFALALGLVFLILVFAWQIPMLYASKPLSTCACWRQPRKLKKGVNRIWVHIGCSVLAIVTFALFWGGQYMTEKRLDDVSAVICSGVYTLKDLVHGAEPQKNGNVDSEKLNNTFIGLAEMETKLRELSNHVDGDNPENFLETAKHRVISSFDIKEILTLLPRLAAVALSNIEEVKAILSSAWENKFIVWHPSLGQQLSELSTLANNDALDMQTLLKRAMEPYTLSSTEHSKEPLEPNQSYLISDFAYESFEPAISAVSIFEIFFVVCGVTLVAVVIIIIILLIIHSINPSACTRGAMVVPVGFLIIYSIASCFGAAFCFFLRQASIPLCNYFIQDFMTVTDSHPFAVWYGLDSQEMALARECLSSEGTGSIVEALGKRTFLDTTLKELYYLEEKITNAIPTPAYHLIPDMGDVGHEATEQSWIILPRNPMLSYNDAFPQALTSGIQEKDYEVNDPQNEVTLVVYGLETLGQLVTPWTIDMTGMKNDEYTITTSKPLLKGPEYKRWKEDFVKQTADQLHASGVDQTTAEQAANTKATRITHAIDMIQGKLRLLATTANCYLSDIEQNITFKNCQIWDLTGGNGGMTNPQNALDSSIINVASSGAMLEEAFREIESRIRSIESTTECTFVRNRIIGMAHQYCGISVDSLMLGSILFILSGIVAFCISTLLLVYVVKTLKGDKTEPQQIPTEGGSEPKKPGKPAFLKLEVPPALTSKSPIASNPSSGSRAPSQSPCSSLVSLSQMSGSVSILNLPNNGKCDRLRPAFGSANFSDGDNASPLNMPKSTTAAISVSGSASSVPLKNHHRDASKEAGDSRRRPSPLPSSISCDSRSVDLELTSGDSW